VGQEGVAWSQPLTDIDWCNRQLTDAGVSLSDEAMRPGTRGGVLAAACGCGAMWPEGCRLAAPEVWSLGAWGSPLLLITQTIGPTLDWMVPLPWRAPGGVTAVMTSASGLLETGFPDFGSGGRAGFRSLRY
jgi:hypothetical protein